MKDFFLIPKISHPGYGQVPAKLSLEPCAEWPSMHAVSLTKSRQEGFLLLQKPLHVLLTTEKVMNSEGFRK
jgi:hypothetical protein